MTTPNDIVKLALLDSGIVGQGQIASANDTNNAFTRLKMMMANWTRRRWLVYHLKTLIVVSTGAQSYTIGPGMQFNCPRIDRIESAFLRQTNTSLPVDYPLDILQSMEDYNRIRLKTLQSFPGSVFLDSGFPTGILYFWPIPLASIYSVAVTIKDDLPVYVNLPDDLNLPPEYEDPLYQNLVVRLRAAYQLPPDPIFVGLAKASLETLRTANAQIPRLWMPGAVTRRGPGYNIIGDQP